MSSSEHSSNACNSEYEIVVFARDDPADPRHWPPAKKRWTVMLVCLYAFCAVFGSSVYAPGETQIRQIYGVNADVSSTGLTLYVLGFGFAPLICPMSEMYGRKIPYSISWVLMIVFSVPSAFVENLAVILVFRFFTGCAAACALNNGGSVIADIYPDDLHALGQAMTMLAFCALSGPCFGTLVGFFVAAHSGRDLWVLRVHLFLAVTVWPLVFLLPESYTPHILAKRAQALRKEGKVNAHAAHELHAKTTMQLMQGHVVRPIAMLIYEPIVQGAAVWITVTYGILYFFFEVYPVVFIDQHEIPFQLCGILFLAISVGMLIAIVAFSSLVRLSEHVRIPLVERRGVGLPMEETHFKVVLSACICLPVSLFWFAWTSGPETHWIAAALAGIPFGYANTTIFFSFNSYSSKTYSLYASSAQAANTFFRSVVASIFPIVAHSIVDNLGTEWGVSLFGFISLGLIPIPFVFIRYGPTLRERSRFASEARNITARMHYRPEKDEKLEIEVRETLDEENTPQ